MPNKNDVKNLCLAVGSYLRKNDQLFGLSVDVDTPERLIGKYNQLLVKFQNEDKFLDFEPVEVGPFSNYFTILEDVFEDLNVMLEDFEDGDKNNSIKDNPIPQPTISIVNQQSQHQSQSYSVYQINQTLLEEIKQLINESKAPESEKKILISEINAVDKSSSVGENRGVINKMRKFSETYLPTISILVDILLRFWK